MSTDANKALVLASIEEGWNMQRLGIFDELFSPDVVDHGVPPGLPQTREGTKQRAVVYWRAFPDLRMTIDDQLAEGGSVVTRWTGRGTHSGALAGIRATGKVVAVSGISIDRLVGGKIVESWLETDRLGMLQQLGAISTVALVGHVAPHQVSGSTPGRPSERRR